ncbi:hypothetical protein FS837_011231 [Tulasnella sp. UAMH 9824]|nr:hypothetical protein FS837_011231 [Tulasnella sp. UAMH 9824]
MPFGFFKGVTADVKLSDDEYVQNEKERYVPFSVNPFRERQETKHEGSPNSEEETERPPEWLELAGDLAWTASFSSLTSSTTVTEPISVWNYGVFFALTWHLWATQTTYDIKYYTNDWWHRALFASQLGIYAILAAFSGSFNVGWEVDGDAMDPFVGNNTALTAQAIRQNEVNSMTKSFRGVNIILFFSRLFLLAQYLRVIWYRRKSKQFWSWRFYLPPASTFVSALIFLGCFIMIKERDGSKSVAITQLSLWALAIFVQILASAITPEDDETILKSKATMAPRLSTLTVIIMGEGLNGICGTLRHSINSLGLTPTMVGEVIAILLVLYFIWLLYFDGFRIKNSRSRALDELWLWSHFPLHLSLIMMLEGIKNLFLLTNVLGASNLWSNAFNEVLAYQQDTGVWLEHPRLESLLLPLKMSWQQEILDVNATFNNATIANPEDDGTIANVAAWAQLIRWFWTGVHGVFLLFNEEPDPEAEFKFTTYIANNDSTIVNDNFQDDAALPEAWIGRYLELMSYTGHWLVAVSGTLLLCMAIVNIMQRRPGNRFAWGYSLHRAAIGLLLILVGGSTSNKLDSESWLYWMIPTVAIFFGLAAIIDLIILRFSIVSIRKKEKDLRGPNLDAGGEKGGYESGRGVNLRQLSELSYGQTPLRQRDATGSPRSMAEKTYPAEEAFDPYAEAGVPYHPHRQGSRGSFIDPTTQSLLGREREGGILNLLS